MRYDLKKTHYEALKDYLSVAPNVERKIFMRDVRERFGDYPDWPTFATESVNLIKSTSEVQILYHLFMMESAGNKIFYVTPNLAARLAKTRPSIDYHYLKAPFRWQFVQIDPGLFTIKDVILKGIHPVHGFYIGLTEQDGQKILRGMAVALLKPTEGLPFNDAVFFFKIILKPGDVEEQIKQFVDSSAKNEQELEKYKGAHNIEHVQEFIAFMVNFLLYTTSRNASLQEQVPEDQTSRLHALKSDAKKRKLQQKIARTPTYRVIIAGGTITDNRDVEDIRRAGSIGEWKLTKRIRVSAHWRTQWYGNEKDNTRRAEAIWISDYDKGPELADVLNKKIILTEGTL